MLTLNVTVADSELPYMAAINDRQHDQRDCQYVDCDKDWCHVPNKERHQYQDQHGSEGTRLIQP